MMRIFSFLLLSLSLFSYSGASSAADFYWTHSSYTQRFASPSAVCHYYRSSVGECQYTACRNESSANNTHIATKLTETQFKCEYYSQPSGFKYGSLIAIRNGDSCPAGQEYNSSNGTCAAPTCPAGQTWNGTSCEAPNPCASKIGQQTQGTTTGNINDPGAKVSRSGDNYINKEREFNMGGCKVDVGLGGPGGKCVFKANGIYACKFPVGYTGEQSSSESDMDELPEDPAPEKTSDIDQQCSSWSESGNGTRTKTCTSNSTASEDGSSTCSRGDYNMTCHKPTPTPQSDTSTRTDDISETTNGDGGKTTTTNSTETNTYCKSGTCTTSTTTSSSSTTTNAAGEVTGESSECSGPKCEGNGEGEGEGGEETFGSPGGGEFGNASDALPAIGEDGDKTYGEATQEYMDRIADSPIVSSLTNITVPSGGSCSIGSASIFGGSVSFNHFCTMAPDVLSGLRYIFLAIWAWAAIRLFFTA